MEYDDIQRFLLGRDQLIAKMQLTEFSEQEIAENRKSVMEILSHDPAIQEKLIQLKESFGRELTKISAAKKQRSVYEGYRQFNDGIYFDNRK